MDEPSNRMHVHGVLVLNGDIERSAVIERLRSRLLRIPRFSQRVARQDGHLVWADDEAFDIDRHVIEETLPAPGGDLELATALQRHLHRPFDPDHPLWEAHLLRRFSGGTVVFMRLHHVIGDGVALLVVLLALTDFELHGAVHSAAAESTGRPGSNPFFNILTATAAGVGKAISAAEDLMPEALRLMRAPNEALERLNPVKRGLAETLALGRLAGRRPDPKTRFKGPLGVEKRVAWTDKVPLDEVKAIGAATGATVNDVLNSAMAGGLHRYLARFGEPDEKLTFRCAMPVSLRPLDAISALGNRFGLVFLPLPVGLADCELRLTRIHERSARLRHSAEPMVALKVLDAMGRLPKFAHGALLKLFGSKATAVFTNMPGPRHLLRFAGHTVRDIFFWVPQAGRLGLGVSIFSYAGAARMGVGTDAGLIPDPQHIVDGFHAEMEALARLGGRA
jgi:diacylglycerol O-acyltransferase